MYVCMYVYVCICKYIITENVICDHKEIYIETNSWQ